MFLFILLLIAPLQAAHPFNFLQSKDPQAPSSIQEEESSEEEEEDATGIIIIEDSNNSK